MRGRLGARLGLAAGAVSTHASHALTENSGDLLSYFRRRVGDEHAADLVAEALATAWRRIALLPSDDESARRWIFGIAHNVLLNDARSRRRQHRLADRLRTRLAYTHAPPADEGLEVCDAIARLKPELAELIRLVYWEGFNLAEAADVVGRPASTVRNEYARAKTQLRELLGEPSPRAVATHR